MPAQAQKQQRKSFFEEERDCFEAGASSSNRAKKTRQKEPKHLSVPAVVAGCVVCVLCTIGGAFLRETSTLFVKDQPAEGYLPVQEFMLRDNETGKEVQHVQALKFADAHTFYSDDSKLVTSRGIKTGDS